MRCSVDPGTSLRCTDSHRLSWTAPETVVDSPGLSKRKLASNSPLGNFGVGLRLFLGVGSLPLRSLCPLFFFFFFLLVSFVFFPHLGRVGEGFRDARGNGLETLDFVAPVYLLAAQPQCQGRSQFSL